LPLSDYSKAWLSGAWPVLAAEAKAAMAVRNQAAASVAPPRSGVYPGSWKLADTANRNTVRRSFRRGDCHPLTTINFQGITKRTSHTLSNQQHVAGFLYSVPAQI